MVVTSWTAATAASESKATVPLTLPPLGRRGRNLDTELFQLFEESRCERIDANLHLRATGLDRDQGLRAEDLRGGGLRGLRSLLGFARLGLHVLDHLVEEATGDLVQSRRSGGQCGSRDGALLGRDRQDRGRDEQERGNSEMVSKYAYLHEKPRFFGSFIVDPSRSFFKEIDPSPYGLQRSERRPLTSIRCGWQRAGRRRS